MFDFIPNFFGDKPSDGKDTAPKAPGVASQPTAATDKPSALASSTSATTDLPSAEVAKVPAASGKASETAGKSSTAASAAPDRPAKLPPPVAAPAAPVHIPRDDIKLQPPTIAVTVAASAVVCAPPEKVKAAPAQTLLASPPLPAGEGEGARLAANVSTPDPATSTAPKSKPSPTPADLPKPATWKNLPAKEPWCPPAIAAHAPELRKVAAADAVAFERVLPGWRAAGASRRGRMHANGGTHREDSFACDAHDRATVLCVSDGAGSCQHSRIGSHVAALRVLEFLLAATEKVDSAVAADATKLKEHLSSKVTEAVLSATDALLDLAKRSGCATKDFRCTLLTALHYRGEQHELLLTNQIGDGAICLLRKDQSTARLGASDSGTHSGEVSCFVPDDCARVKAKAVDVISDVAALECVLLCSDGIEDPFYPLEKQAAGIFRQFYKGVDQPLKDFKAQLPQAAPLLQESAAWGLAQWLEFEKRGENDDRTVAVLHRQPVNVSW